MALVHQQAGARGQLQFAAVDRACAGREVGMLTCSVWTSARADINRTNRHVQAVLTQLVSDDGIQRKRISGLRVKARGHHHAAMRLALGRPPRAPAQQAVNRIALCRLGERELVVLAVELVAALGKLGWATAARPRRARRRKDLPHLVRVQDRLAGDRCTPAQPTPHLDDRGALLAEARSRTARPRGALASSSGSVRANRLAAPVHIDLEIKAPWRMRHGPRPHMCGSRPALSTCTGRNSRETSEGFPDDRSNARPRGRPVCRLVTAPPDDAGSDRDRDARARAGRLREHR